MANRKETIMTVIAFVIILGGLFTLLRNQISNKEKSNIPITSPAKIASSTSDQWTTYHNQIYHYRIDYPSNLLEFMHSSEPESISFVKEEDDAWEISVHIESTLFHTLEEWIEKNRQDDIKYPKENKIPTMIIERDIIISGTYRGVVVHYPEMRESFWKNVFFVRDGLLFQISINNPNIDRERVWKSFAFE